MRLSSCPSLQLSPDLRPPAGFQEGERKESWQWLEKTTSMIILSIRYLLGPLLKGKWCVGEKVFRSHLCRKGKGLCKTGAGELRSPRHATPPHLFFFFFLSPCLLLSGKVGEHLWWWKYQGKYLGYFFWRYDFVNQQAISELRDSGRSSSPCLQSKYLCFELILILFCSVSAIVSYVCLSNKR